MNSITGNNPTFGMALRTRNNDGCVVIYPAGTSRGVFEGKDVAHFHVRAQTPAGEVEHGTGNATGEHKSWLETQAAIEGSTVVRVGDVYHITPANERALKKLN